MASTCQEGNSSEKRGIKRSLYDADNSIEQELVSDIFIEGNFNYDDLFKEGSFNYDDLFKEDSINDDDGSKEIEINGDDVQREVKTYEAVKKSRNKKFKGLSVEEADHLRLKFNKEVSLILFYYLEF